MEIANNEPNLKELSKHFDPYWIENLRVILLAGEVPIRKDLTVVFWDISGFSDLCNNLESFPPELAIFLKMYFDLAVDVIKKNDGILDKFMGDGILAFFGQDNKNKLDNGDPDQAIIAAVKFRTKFKEIKEKFVNYCGTKTGKDASKINLKCGIHSGPVFFYYFNNDSRNAIIQMGPTVNLASRLEDVAKNDEIIVSEELKNKVKGKFNFIDINLDKRMEKQEDGGFIKAFPHIKKVYGFLS